MEPLCLWKPCAFLLQPNKHAPNQSTAQFLFSKLPLDPENCLSFIERLDLLLPLSVLKQSKVFPVLSFFPPCSLFLPPSSHPISKRWSSYQHYPPDLASPLQCDGGLNILLSRLTLALKLRQPDPQSPGQLPTFLLYSLFSFLWCVHVSFTQRKGDLFRTLQEEQEEPHKIKDEQHSQKCYHFQRPPIGSSLFPL